MGMLYRRRGLCYHPRAFFWSTMTQIFFVALLSLLACSEEKAAPKAPPAPAVAPPAPPPAAVPAPAANDAALVPSPGQVQKAMEDAGITADIQKLVKQGVLRSTAESKDEVAVRTGVLLSHLVLTAKTAPKADTLARLAAVKTGFVAMGAGSDIPRTIDELTARLNNDAVNGADLVKELDDLARVLVPEVSYEAGPRMVPLIQAGAWLAGTNVVAGAIDASGKTEAATTLLRRPEVVAYFLKVVKTEGSSNVAASVLGKLEAALLKLQKVSGKPTLSKEDVQAVQTTTADVLALL